MKHCGQPRYPESVDVMHELTVIENIMNISREVAKDNDLEKITSVNLEVGRMQHLNEEIMQHGFDVAKKETVAEEAELKMSWLPVKLKCNSCQNIFGHEGGQFYCPYCGEKDTSVIQGIELTVKSIEGE